MRRFIHSATPIDRDRVCLAIEIEPPALISAKARSRMTSPFSANGDVRPGLPVKRPSPLVRRVERHEFLLSLLASRMDLVEKRVAGPE
jgi:hypothetical protein